MGLMSKQILGHNLCGCFGCLEMHLFFLTVGSYCISAFDSSLICFLFNCSELKI